MRLQALRIALGANALFSGVCGMLLLGAPDAIAMHMGLSPHWLFPAVGAGLLLFAAELVFQCTRPRMAPWRALLASLADLLWVVGSAIVLLLMPQALSADGRLLVLLVAIAVLVFAIAQIRGIRYLYQVAPGGRYRHCLLLSSPAAAENFWSVLWRVGEIERYAPSLARSELLGTQQARVGAVRRCADHSRRHWEEEIIDVDPGRGLTLRFRAEAPGFPFPFREMTGGWQIDPKAAGCEVTLWWECVPRRAWQGPLVMPLLAAAADRDFVEVVARMSAAAMGRDIDAPDIGRSVRLLPTHC